MKKAQSTGKKLRKTDGMFDGHLDPEDLCEACEDQPASYGWLTVWNFDGYACHDCAEILMLEE